jgi:uncharacterized membrane protein YbhN (UPF0104 family)
LYAFGIKLAVGLGLLGFILWRYDMRSTFDLVRRERAGVFTVTVVLFVALQLLSAFRWQLLARLNGVGVQYRYHLAYYLIGMFTNVFVPGLVGGDALRALYLGRRQNRIAQAAASVVADRVLGLLGLFWFAAIASVWIKTPRLPGSIYQITLAAAGISLLAFLLSPFLVRIATRVNRLSQILAPIEPYLRRPFALAPALAISIVLQFSFALCQYVLGLGLSLTIPLSAFLLVVPLSNVIASVPISINGLGLREASYVVLLGMAGVSRDKAVALSICYFAATLIGGLSGIIPFVLTPIPGAEIAPDAEQPEGLIASRKTTAAAG